MSRIAYTGWSTTGLLAKIARDAMLPANQNTFTTDDRIAFLNDEASNTVVPFIVGLDANYFLKTVLMSVSASNSTALGLGSAASQGSNVAYQLPTDAIGKKLGDVAVITSNGNMITLPQVTSWQAGAPGGIANGVWVEGDVLYLFPASRFNAMMSLQLIYPATPLKLCDDTGTPTSGEATSASITAVNTTTGEITLAVLPASWGIGTEVNFVKGTPQFATAGVGSPAITALGVSSVTVDPATLLNATGSVAVEAGDWVADVGYAPFLQMPQEAVNLVAQSAVVRLLQALADDNGWQRAQAKYDKMEAAAIKIFTPRVNDSPKVLSTMGRGIASWRRYGPWIT